MSNTPVNLTESGVRKIAQAINPKPTRLKRAGIIILVACGMLGGFLRQPSNDHKELEKRLSQVETALNETNEGLKKLDGLIQKFNSATVNK